MPKGVKVSTHYVTSCSNLLSWWHVVATNHFVCSGEFLWKSLSLQQNFVTATCCKKSNQTEFVRLFTATKFCCRDKDFPKISPVHMKRLIAAMCRRNVLLQLVVGPVHMEWSVATSCCFNLSGSVYRPLVCSLCSWEDGYVPGTFLKTWLSPKRASLKQTIWLAPNLLASPLLKNYSTSPPCFTSYAG